jgi:hypothetical protein
MNKFPKLIATSVVRGSQQGESHGGIYTLDFENQVAEQHVDWNTGGIDFEGRGADRGLRGITFDGNDIYVAASDELFCYDRNFRIQSSYRNRYLKHCHEIVRKDRYIFLTSTGFDSLLVFDIDKKAFVWGINLVQQAFSIKQYPESDIELAGIDDSKIARQGFGRGFCLIDDRFIAGGSSPSTISLYDLDANQMVGCVNISMDIRNAIHGLEVFPESDAAHVI